MVGREHGEVDDLHGDHHQRLGQSNPVGRRPISELVVVAEGVLHAAEALLGLVCEGDVEDHGTQEPGKYDALGSGGCFKTINHILIC